MHLNLFNNNISGAEDNPCPKVCAPVAPVYLQIEKPAVVFAETEDVNVPSVFDDAVPPPFQFHDT